MIITIEVPGPPVSKNKGLRIDPRRLGMPMFRPQEATQWMIRIRHYAQGAARAAGWPDPFDVAEAAISFRKFDCKHDSGAGNEYVFDALQVPRPRDMKIFGNSWGLYANDRDAWARESPPPVKDGQGRRCVFEIELLKIREPKEAERLRQMWRDTVRRDHEKMIKKLQRNHGIITASTA